MLEKLILKQVKFKQGSFISTEESREVFLVYEEFDILQDGPLHTADAERIVDVSACLLRAFNSRYLYG